MSQANEGAAASSTARRPIEPRDLFDLRAVGTPAIHPTDGSVVYNVAWPDGGTDTNRSVLHVFTGAATDPAGGGVSQQISYGHRDASPRFSPDGTRLLFIRSEPDKPTSLMLLHWSTRQLDTVATFDDGIAGIRWLDDRRALVLAASRPDDQVGVDDDELARRPRVLTKVSFRFDNRGWTNDRLQQVFVADTTSEPGKTTIAHLGDLVADGGYDLASADHLSVVASPDGSTVAVIATSDDDADITGGSRVWLHHLDGTTPSRCITPEPGLWEGLLWHRDGPLIALGLPDAADSHGFARPHRLDLDGGPPALLGRHDVNANPLGGGELVGVDGGILAAGIRRGAVNLDHYGLADGSLHTRCEGPFQIGAFDASPDGSRVVASVATLDRPAELWQLAPGEPTRLVSLNDDLLAKLDVAVTEAVTIERPGGPSIEAFITRPPASARATGERRPGLVYVHGGPMFQYGYTFFDEFQMAAAAGYVVIGGNPRGSDGYGEEWATSIVGQLGTDDWSDVTAIADYLAAQPDVDGQRLGIGGGSYGGFMAAWAISHTDRFRAALVERAAISWTTMASTSDIGPPFIRQLAGATIESDPEALARQSPITYAASISTPALILHSEEDWRCSIEQAEQLFAAIRRNGGDVTLVRFPGECHELSRSGSPRHRVERFEIIHGFFDRHLVEPATAGDGGEGR
jgi:dipeptidyl aminopeptidase/acylaminoacyl peptidase